MAAAKYIEIYEVLRARIEAGDYGFREFLPSENALARDFATTRNTVRKALAHLVGQGYVQAMQGRGAQVIHRPRSSSLFFISAIESFAEACERMGVSARTVVLSEGLARIDGDLAAVSGLPEGAQALTLVRLRLIEQRPVIIDRSWFLTDVVPSIPREAATTSVYHYLEDVLGVRSFSSPRMITIEAADELDRQYLDLRGLGCVGVMESLDFDATGTPFEYTVSHHVPETFGFTSVARRLPPRS